MDLNPYQFKASFREYEFARYHIKQQTEIILCSMAWLLSDESNDDYLSEQISDDEPDNSTINYWCDRLLPFFTDSETYSNVFPTGTQNPEPKRNVLFVACNRTGIENGSLLDIIIFLNYIVQYLKILLSC
jgi:protein N-terminal amidase